MTRLHPKWASWQVQSPDEIYCENMFDLPVGLRAQILSLETVSVYVRVWMENSTDFVLQGINVLRESVQVWKLGRFPRSQSTDIDTERQGLALQFSGFHNPVVQKGLKTGLKIVTVLWFLIKAVFRNERIVISDVKSLRSQLSSPHESVYSEIKRRTQIRCLIKTEEKTSTN